MRTGGPGEAGSRRAGRDEDQSERLEAQGDELRADGKRGRSWKPRSAGWIEAAAAADDREDAALGRDKRGDELPEWVADRQAAGREDPRGEGGTGGRSESGGRGGAESEGRSREETRSGRPKATRKARRPALWRPRPESTDELHRSREPDHEDRGRLHPGLQRRGGGGRPKRR